MVFQDFKFLLQKNLIDFRKRYLEHISSGSKYRSCIKDNKLLREFIALPCRANDKFIVNWVLQKTKQRQCCRLSFPAPQFLSLDVSKHDLQTKLYLKYWTRFWLGASHDKISFFNIVPAQDWQATLKKREYNIVLKVTLQPSNSNTEIIRWLTLLLNAAHSFSVESCGYISRLLGCYQNAYSPKFLYTFLLVLVGRIRSSIGNFQVLVRRVCRCRMDANFWKKYIITHPSFSKTRLLTYQHIRLI